ncbi:alpha-aminoadipic semialdehyde synthase, mitochondrial-like [Amphiura filiformis]|uniref:alpha-aminoadipic semialdehyde synthase, mitochondrial-like n=1 Tax=Amphiura filiformis TaxID=82378 RepID=UPI003B213361
MWRATSIKQATKYVGRHVTYCNTARTKTTRVMGIRREDYGSQWERRAPLTPLHVKELVESGVKVLVQPSNRRAYTMQDYQEAGAVIQEDMSEASLILGVKQVPIPHLMPNKTYCIFSHTIKAQKENMPLLDAIIEKNIRLIDYEKIVDESGKRVVAFGKFAGIAGMINILHGIGLRLLALGHHSPFIHIAAAHNYRNSGMATQAVRDAGYEIALGLMPKSIGPLTFVFMGSGNVCQGAEEVIRHLPVTYVEPKDLRKVAEQGDTRKVYATTVHRKDHIVRRGGGPFVREEYDAHPELYRSVFSEKIAPWSSCIVNGIFWNTNHPRFLANMDTKMLLSGDTVAKMPEMPGCPNLPHRLIAICDITADPGGSIEFITDCSSIESPFCLYDADHKHEIFKSLRFSGDGVLTCSIDNMPTQLPREATDFFGGQFHSFIPELLTSDASVPFEISNFSKTIGDAVIASNGKLTSKYEYISSLRDKTMEIPVSVSAAKHKVLLLGSGNMALSTCDYLMKDGSVAVTVASADKEEAEVLADRWENTSPVYHNVETHEDQLDKLIKEHDLVMSLLPLRFHPAVAKKCVQHKVNMVTTSYVSPQMRALQQAAVDANICLVNEVGLDPGIDHMLAMESFSQIKEEGGKVTSFESWCGGLPAPEFSDNPLRYKFNWSPAAALGSLVRDAKYLMDGEEVYIPPGMLMDAKNVKNMKFLPGFNLEGYPNRDSTSYVFSYGIPTAHTVIRGTLRYKGFCNAATGFVQAGLVDERQHPMLNEGGPDVTWHELMCSVVGQSKKTPSSTLESILLERLGNDQDKLDAIIDLDLLSDQVAPKKGSLLDTLSAHLQARLTYENNERDLVILRHTIGFEESNGRKGTEEINLTVYGKSYGGLSSMAKCVGYPAAIATKMILEGELVNKGVVIPLSKDVYHPILNRLKAEGIRATSKTKYHN